MSLSKHRLDSKTLSQDAQHRPNPCYHPVMAYLIGSSNPSDTVIHPIWALRVIPAVSLLALILAQTLFTHNPNWHDALIGFATGLLLVLVVIGFGARAIIMKDTPQPSDVQDLRITR